MFRTLLVLLAALVLVPAALADGGPAPGVLEGGPGVLGPHAAVRYVTVPTATATTLEALATNDGRVLNWTSYRGGWGIPSVAFDGTAGGLSTDGSRLVLAQSGFGACSPAACKPLRAVTLFQVIRTKTLRRQASIVLDGDFAFDALSPDASRLYLIQHVSATNLSRYLVRAYDLDRHALLPGAIADRTQRGWVMQGSPMARATSPSGRFVYTLYQNQGNYPFVHALDAVRGTAHCIGLPWTGDQGGLVGLRLDRSGRRLTVAGLHGEPLLTIDTRTDRVAEPGAHPQAGFPWWTLAPGALVLLAAAFRRRLRRLAARRRTVPAVAPAK